MTDKKNFEYPENFDYDDAWEAYLREVEEMKKEGDEEDSE
jgi:ferredoxin